MPLDELAIIDRFLRPLAGEGAFGFRDDAGLLAVPPDRDLVVTTDMVVESVHFLPGDPPDSVARKALRVNLSDLAAKGAAPLAYTLSLGLPPDVDAAWLSAFAAGLDSDQQQFGVGLLGGDTIAVPERTVISITAFGLVPKGRMVHRFSGKPGDMLYVSGTIGEAAAGLAILKKGVPGEGQDRAEGERLVARYRVPEPRVGLAAALVDFASAAMDVSDGLVGDCDKLAAASQCTATIRAERVPLPASVVVGGNTPTIVADLLTGGDDYEILAAVPPANDERFVEAARRAEIPVARIGELRAGSGLVEVLLGDRPLEFPRRSYVHRRGEGAL